MAKTKGTTLFEFMGEINTYARIEDGVMAKAKEANITTVNNKSLKGLVSDWINGVYDEDPEYLASELSNLIG
jgi:predicted ATPase